jgi:hypothetical protein
VNHEEKYLAYKDLKLEEGEFISLDGNTGKFYLEKKELVHSTTPQESAFLSWLGIDSTTKKQCLAYHRLFYDGKCLESASLKLGSYAFNYYLPSSRFLLGRNFFVFGDYKIASALLETCLYEPVGRDERELENLAMAYRLLALSAWRDEPTVEGAKRAVPYLKKAFELAHLPNYRSRELSKAKIWYDYLWMLQRAERSQEAETAVEELLASCEDLEDPKAREMAFQAYLFTGEKVAAEALPKATYFFWEALAVTYRREKAEQIWQKQLDDPEGQSELLHRLAQKTDQEQIYQVLENVFQPGCNNTKKLPRARRDFTDSWQES